MDNQQDILEVLADLYHQAVTERSHYYTGKALVNAITEIKFLRASLKDCKKRYFDLLEQLVVSGDARKL